MTFTSILGDIAHFLIVLNLIAFTIATVSDSALLDPLWKEQGFCICDPDVPYKNSHDYCLYVGVFLATVLKITLYLLDEEPGMQVTSDFLEPKLTLMVVHVICHGILGTGLRLEIPANHWISVYLPVLGYLVYSWNEWKNPVKGFEYALFPWLVGLPASMLWWIESIYCSEWVINLWGHLLHDVFLFLAMLQFYMICWVKGSLTSRDTQKQKVS